MRRLGAHGIQPDGAEVWEMVEIVRRIGRVQRLVALTVRCERSTAADARDEAQVAGSRPATRASRVDGVTLVRVRVRRMVVLRAVRRGRARAGVVARGRRFGPDRLVLEVVPGKRRVCGLK